MQNSKLSLKNFIFLFSIMTSFGFSKDLVTRADLVSLAFREPQKQVIFLIFENKMGGEFFTKGISYEDSSIMRDDAVALSRGLIEAAYNQGLVAFENDRIALMRSKTQKEYTSFNDIVFNPAFLSVRGSLDQKSVYLVFEQIFMRKYKQSYMLGHNSFESIEAAEKFAQNLAEGIESAGGSGIKVSAEDFSIKISQTQIK